MAASQLSWRPVWGWVWGLSGTGGRASKDFAANVTVLSAISLPPGTRATTSISG